MKFSYIRAKQISDQDQRVNVEAGRNQKRGTKLLLSDRNTLSHAYLMDLTVQKYSQGIKKNMGKSIVISLV